MYYVHIDNIEVNMLCVELLCAIYIMYVYAVDDVICRALFILMLFVFAFVCRLYINKEMRRGRNADKRENMSFVYKTFVKHTNINTLQIYKHTK